MKNCGKYLLYQSWLSQNQHCKNVQNIILLRFLKEEDQYYNDQIALKHRHQAKNIVFEQIQMILALKKKVAPPSYKFINENKFHPLKYIFTTPQFPLKLKLYFSQLQDLFQKSSVSRSSKYQGIDELFAAKFVKLSEKQKQQMMVHLISAVIQEIKGSSDQTLRDKLTSKNDNEVGKRTTKEPLSTIDRIQTSCKLESSNWGLTVWLEVKFKLENSRRIITITHKKKNITAHLQNYIVRQSKKRKQTLIFQSISSSVSEQNTKITLYFEESVYPVIYQQLFKTMIQISKETLLRIVGDDQSYSERSSQLSDRLPTHDGFSNENDKNLVFLTPQQVGNYMKWRNDLLKKLKSDSFGFRIYQYNPQEKITLFKSNKKESYYLLEFGLENQNPEEVRKELLNGYKNRCRYRTGRNIVQEYSKRFTAIYDRYLIGNKIYEQISIEEESCSNQDVIFVKGIQNVMTQNLIEFLYINIEKKNTNNVKVSVFVSFTNSKDLKQQNINSFLIQLREMLLRSEHQQTVLEIENQVQQQQIFYTIIGKNNPQNDVSIEIDVPNNPILPEEPIDLKKAKSLPIINFLTHRYILSPISLTQQELKNKIIKQHYLFKEWSRCKNGGVVCTNETMLQEQMKMTKSIIANIGANIYKIVRTGGLLTMSLPVTIFKKQSHLQTIANNFTFAPLLFDNVGNDPLVRLKKAVIFTISVSNLGVSSQKPFNPILGQTLQCWVGGCPLYLQQITHQPPNSAFLLEGRGYRITGQIESKVGIAGLNTAKCWSERQNLIEFEDGTKIALTFSRMLIKGILMGDREFHFQDKLYVYDMTNHYFAQVNFGPRKKGKLDPQDYIHGRIFRTTSGYLNKFKSKTPPVFPSKEDIAKDLCEIEGIWNQSILFDGKQEFNFMTTLPYALEMQEHPLPSNSSHRKDLQHYITGNKTLAQEHKQIMEQQQRRDRKLREQHAK